MMTPYHIAQTSTVDSTGMAVTSCPGAEAEAPPLEDHTPSSAVHEEEEGMTSQQEVMLVEGCVKGEFLYAQLPRKVMGLMPDPLMRNDIAKFLILLHAVSLVLLF